MLKYYRLLANLTQAQLADKTGISIRTIQKYESGERDIKKASAESVHKLAKALNVTIDDLIK